jgi:hypothetical protein
MNWYNLQLPIYKELKSKHKPLARAVEAVNDEVTFVEVASWRNIARIPGKSPEDALAIAIALGHPRHAVVSALAHGPQGGAYAYPQ